MTPEAAYAKAVFLLSQGLRGAELAAWMGRSIAGELNDRPDGAPRSWIEREFSRNRNCSQ